MTKVLGSKYFNDISDELCIEFIDDVKDIVCIDEYQKLKNYTHHYYTTRYQHCLNVAWYSFILSHKFHLDARSCARGAMLHDFYLYEIFDLRKFSKSFIVRFCINIEILLYFFLIENFPFYYMKFLI